LFIKQKMTLFQVSTVFQNKYFDFKPNNVFEQKNSRLLKINQYQKNSIILNLFGLDVVFGNFKFYGLNDVKQVIQKIIKK
jgi:hypothetical protein